MLPRKFYLDNIFDNFIDNGDNDLMKCDIYEKEDNYHIESDIPGIDKKDINIECHNGYLTITATKETDDTINKNNFIRKERFYGTMKRKFYVGNVLEDDIKATFKDGVLKIDIPKEDKDKNKKIIEIED
ncbi:MAG: Hsp20/alpha crystallin family protein [Bacilli bacterium]